MNGDINLVILVTSFQNDVYEIQTLDSIHTSFMYSSIIYVT